MSIIFKRTIQAARAKRLSCALIAACMAIVMMFGMGVIIPASATLDGKMLEVYNQNGWSSQQIEQQYKSLPAGTYELSGYFKHEGGWSMEAAVYNNGWIKAPGAIVTESENEYFTTIEFTLTAATNFSVIFKSPTSTNKLWLTGVTLRNKTDAQDVNLLKNGDFSNGTTGWSFSNQAAVFSNAQIKDIEDSFFDKDTIAPPSGNMMQVYNESGWTDQSLYRRVNALSAGTYKLSVYYKHEGDWSLQILQSSDMNGSFNPVPGATVTESETQYFTTIKFTLTATSYIRAQFNAPSNTNKLWLANLSLQHISGGNDVGRCTNYFGNPDFTVTRDGLPAGLAFWTFTNLSAAFPNAQAMDIEDGFFKKIFYDGKMLEVYNQNGWSSQQIEQQYKSLPAGTYELSGYFKHEGGWSMEAAVYNNGWIKAPDATVTESESEYLTTIEFTLTSPTNFSVIFKAPTSTNKLWIACLTLRNKADEQDVNLLKNGNFSNGTTGWSFSNQANVFSNAQTLDIEAAFFDKSTVIAPPSGNMMQVYNESGWTDQLLYRRVNALSAGTYKLSVYYKHEGGWSLQVLQSSDMNGSYVKVPGATVTESEDKYFTTITFTLTATSYIRAQFNAPTNTNKMWLANLSLQHISGGNDMGRCTNYFGNPDFTVTRDGLPAGLAFWTFTNLNTAFPNAKAMDIEDGFFDKDEVTEPSSDKMLEVYNQSGWSGQQIEQQIASLPAGTYELSGHFKHEGGWSMEAEVYSDGWIKAPGATVTESQSEYLTTIEFTLTSPTNFSVIFKAPQNKSKLWISDITLRKKTDAQNVNLLKNGDFSNGTTDWSFTNKDTAFSNAQTMDIEDAFFDKATVIEPLDAKMLEVYNQSSWGGQQIEQQYKSLPAGTYELSGYFKHEGGWSMQAAVYSGGWIQAPGATVTESESEYLTTIEFTLTSPTNFSVIFKAPQNKSKLWIAGITLRKKTDAQDVNLLKNGNFSNGTTSWSFTNKNTAFPNAVTNDIPDGFFDVPEKKMAVLYNQNPSWGGQIFEAIIGMVPAGDYSFSVNFKHDGSWSVGPCYWDGSKWASIPGAQTDKSTDEYKTTVSFTLSSTQNVRIFFNAPKNTGVAYIANAKLYRTDIQSQNYITNGDFSNEFANWHYANNSFDNIYLADIPEGFFMRGPLAQQMIHVKSKGGSGTINQWLDLKTDAEYYFSYDINYADEPDKVVGAAAYVNLQYPTSSGYQYYLPYSIEVSEERYTKKYEIRVNDLAVSSNGVARIMIGLQIMPREAYIANLVLTEKGKTENLLNNPDFVYGFEGWNQGSPCIELVPYDNSKFVRNEQNTPSPLTDKYMLYTDGSSSYDDFGQHLKLPRTNGTTEIMYEFQCRYRATDGFPALRMAYHPVGATRFADDARNQGSFNVYSEYDEETGNWYGIFTIPKNAYIDKDGFAHIFLSVNTELSGAGYFTDFKLFDITNDENKTKNLLVNPDFKQGLWGWVGKGMWTVPELNFNTLRFTECKELFGLVPYDEKMFIKSDSEQYFDDGQWWIKYGETKDEQDDSENTQVLKGRMTFSDGSPIVGAPLILRSYQIHNTYTDMDGFFEFRDIPAGNYSLYMGMEDGSESLILDVNVKQGDVITVSAAYNLEIGSFDDVTNTVGKGTSSKDPSADKATNNNGKLNIIILIIIAIGAVLLVGGGITAVIFVKKKKKIIE